MPSSRIPSPARSQGVISTPRRDKLRRRTRSVCSPAQSNVPVRLSSLVSNSYKLSPMPNRRSVLTDETDIEIVPGRQSWWKKLDDNSRDVMDVLETKDMAEIKNLADEFDVEVLSQEKQNYTLDIPESSDGESISSIVIPQRKLFTQKDHNLQKDFGQIINNRDSQSKHKSHIDHEEDIEVAPKNLFSQPSKPRNRPVFPAALLNISANKTMNKTKEMPVAEVKSQIRSLFGNRPGTKRKNMFADFIVSDSEDDIPDIQPKVFGFQNNVKKKRRESSSSRASRHSPTSSIDLELDDWKLLPSSTLVGNQLEDTTPVKRARLSKLSEVKETDTVSTINKTMNKTKQSNKSVNAKNKSKISSNSKLDVESSKLQDDKINVIVQSNDLGTNSSTSRLTRNRSKSIRETSLTVANRSKTINKSKNITIKDQSKVNKVDVNRGNINLSQDGGNIQNELLDEGEDNEDFTLEYENDDEQNNESIDNNPNDCRQSTSQNDTLKQTINKNIIGKKNQSVQEGTDKEDTNKSQQINNNMDIDMLDGNATKEPVQVNNKQEIQNINNEKLSETENVNNKTNESTYNTSQKHNKSKQNKVETENKVNQENHNNTRDQIEKNNSRIEPNNVSQEIEHEGDHQDQSKPISKEKEEENENKKLNNTVENEEANEKNKQNSTESNENENMSSEQNNSEQNEEENESNEQNVTMRNEEENVSSEQNNTEENEEIVSDIEDQNESLETQNESQHETDQIDSEQEQNETEEEEDMEDNNQELNQSDKDEENDFDSAQQDDEGVTSNNEEENESTVNKTDERQNESIEINENEEENEEQDEEDEENDIENEEQEVENKEEEDDEEQEIENNHQESNESEVEGNEDESEEADQDGPIEAENDNEDEEVKGNENDESPNITHDTTGKHRNIQKVTSPEAILHDKTNQIDSFMAEGRKTSVRKTKSIMIKTLNIRPSLAPVRESTGFSDGTRNSSADNSGWDSHRTTRKTLRQTFGKDFTPRKSLRALVMEKSAKRHTNFMEKQADLTENVDNTKVPQANSTELPHFDSYEDPEPVHVDETPVSSVEESNHEEHEMSKRTRQTTLEMYLQKIKQDNLERKRKIEEQVRNSLKTTTQAYNPFKVLRKPVRRVKPPESKPRTKQTRPLVSMDMLPAEVIEDMKYKPPKRFQPNNASWITKRLYKFLETKLEPKYDYKARVRAEKLVETIYNFTKDVKKHHVAPLQMVDALKLEMARLNIVTTHFDFYEFFHGYMPREIRIKVNPDAVNNIPLPKHGVFADIIR